MRSTLRIVNDYFQCVASFGYNSLMTLITVDTAKIGRMGGNARAANMSADERSTSASEAARSRWDAYYKQHPEKLKVKLEKAAKAKRKAKK